VRVDFTRLRVFKNKTMRVESTRMRVGSTRMRVVKKTSTTKKAKHGAGVDLRFMCIIMSLK
jgi:hypothetical protein